MVNNYIRGGQIFLHKIRMFTQVWYKNIFFALCFATLASIYLSYPKFIKIDSDASITYAKAIFLNKIDNAFSIASPLRISASSRYGNYSKQIEAKRIISHPFFKKKFEFCKDTFLKFLQDIIIWSIIGYILILILWNSFGKLSNRRNILKGGKIFNPKEAIKTLKKLGLESNLQIGKMPLIKDSETSHILLTGTTGSGKTTAMNMLLDQIRDNKQSAIIMDYNGLMSKRYCQEGDIIIGTKHHSWDLFEDIRDSDNLSIIANALYDNKGSSHDEMWNNASKSLFKDSAKIIMQNSPPLISDFYKLIAIEPLKDLHKKLAGSGAGSIMDPNNEKTALSVRTNTLAYLDWMESMKDSLNKVSISDWIRNSKGSWIFLQASPKERASLSKMYSIILDLSIHQIMELGPDPKRRIWMIMDELPSLKKLPSLSTALSEFRKYGGCIMASLQSPHQLFEIYGHSNAYSMLDQFNTKLIFRTEEYNFANYLCKSFGNLEYIEKSENYSYGSHEIRDGVNISSLEKNKAIITPRDLSSLNNLECYMSLPLNEVKLVRLKLKHLYHEM